MHSSPNHRTRSLASSRGAALVLVLGCLVLLSILVVAFLASIKSEIVSSSSYASGTDVKQRAQTAVNMVIAQIQEASSSSATAWTSQPGLIRTFDDTGVATEAYKLYSSGTMLGGSSFDPNSGADVPPDWKNRPSEYTDLNQPVLVSDAGGPISKNNTTYTPNYPILDPGALGTIKGFSIDGNSSTPPNYSSIDPTVNNPAPMPTQWLYILQDGSIRAMDPGSKQIPDASNDNPIVSRIAFWTDDESSKININTAAGDEWNNETNPGAFMDMPRSRNDFEQTLRSTQPVNHEYQRYPGHPATTYLSAVFPWLTRAQIGAIVPKVGAGGSEGGSKTTYSGNTSTVAALPLTDGLPLYASIDELRFVRSTAARTTQDTLFTPRQLESSKFFLTANSRAPEVNLFNRPRISLWPQPATLSARTAFDKTIAFCSTVANQPFYFTRNDPNSTTSDYQSSQRNQDLYAYLQDLTGKPIPGFGGSFLTKYPSPGQGKPTERDQILTEIYDYIRSSINLIDSQSGATPFAGPKVNNMKTHTVGGPGQVVPIHIGDTMGFGRVSTLYEPFLQIFATETVVAPAALTLYDKYDSAYANNPDGVLKGQLSTQFPARKHENAQLAQLITRKIQVALLFNTYSVAHGPVRFVPNLIFEVSGLDKLSINDVAVDFSGETLSTTFGRWAPNHEYAWGSVSSPANLFWIKGTNTKKTWGNDDPATKYPFVSRALTLPAGGSEAKSPLNLKGGPMQLKIYAVNSQGSKGDLIQTINFEFPNTTVPTPFVKGSYTRTYNNTGPQYNDDPTVKSASQLDTDFFTNVDAGSFAFSTSYVRSNKDAAVIRSSTRGLGAGGVSGDIRLVAASQNVPDTVFTPLPGYFLESAKITPPLTVAPGAPPPPTYNYGFAYDFTADTDPSNPKSDGMISGTERLGNSGGYTTFAGSLAPGVTYDKQINAGNSNLGPAVSWGVTSALLVGRNGSPALGDWDTGMGNIPDGAFINKADEGELGNTAYFSHDYLSSNATLFSPNRQVPSAGILGSLSTGVVRGRPWQTLLFCPNPAAKSEHPGFVTPEDHLFLDFFTMPVVEPYVISEPFSTAGKINLNYQIVPFTNIKRSTGMQALLRSVRIAAIPTGDGLKYKSGTVANTGTYRHLVDIDETLKAFQDRFDNNKVFKSASQICEMFLVPKDKGASQANIANWWDDYQLTGDNLRENPYTQLYSRLTTKSNTYTVHVRVQSLKKAGRDQPGKWVEGKDKVVGEHRGSFTIERYIDPGLETYNSAQPLTAYKFRTLSTKHFTP